MKKMITLLAVAGLVLALGFGATTALALATWDGGGDGSNWSDNAEFSGDGWGNWDSDPALGDFIDLRPAGLTHTIVDLDTTSWAINRFESASDDTDSTVTIPAGGTLRTSTYMRGGLGKMYLTGGTLICGRWQPTRETYVQATTALPDSYSAHSGLLEISGGTVTFGNDYQVTKDATFHIVGTGAASVTMNIYQVVDDTVGADPTFRFTLDAGGVTPLAIGSVTYVGTGSMAPVIEVLGIDNYTGPTGPDNKIRLIDCADTDLLTNVDVGTVVGGTVSVSSVGGEEGVWLEFDPPPPAGTVITLY